MFYSYEIFFFNLQFFFYLCTTLDEYARLLTCTRTLFLTADLLHKILLLTLCASGTFHVSFGKCI